jgi:hypothetical protein
MKYDLPNYLTALAFLPTAAVAADGNGAPFDLSGYEGKILARVDAANATAGTSPTLDLVFKQSTDNSNWVNANIAFTQITADTNEVVVLDPRDLYRYVRLDKDIGGTNSPSFPVSVVGFAQKQYNPG